MEDKQEQTNEEEEEEDIEMPLVKTFTCMKCQHNIDVLLGLINDTYILVQCSECKEIAVLPMEFIGVGEKFTEKKTNYVG